MHADDRESGQTPLSLLINQASKTDKQTLRLNAGGSLIRVERFQSISIYTYIESLAAVGGVGVVVTADFLTDILNSLSLLLFFILFLFFFNK